MVREDIFTRGRNNNFRMSAAREQNNVFNTRKLYPYLQAAV